MESDLKALLLGYAPLVAVVGNNPGGAGKPAAGPSLYWNEIVQAALDPVVSLFNIVPGVSYHYQGPSSLKGALVQINVRALSFASAVAVRDAIEARLSGFRGTQGSTVFGGIFLRDTRSSSEKPGTVLYHTFQMDWDVWHRPV